jgi:hypothetical protein
MRSVCIIRKESALPEQTMCPEWRHGESWKQFSYAPTRCRAKCIMLITPPFASGLHFVLRTLPAVFVIHVSCCILLSRLLNHISCVLITSLTFCSLFLSSCLARFWFNYYCLLASLFFIIFAYHSVFSPHHCFVSILLFFGPSFTMFIFSSVSSFYSLIICHWVTRHHSLPSFLLSSSFFPQIFPYLPYPEERGTKLGIGIYIGYKDIRIGIYLINCIAFLPTRQ